MAILNPINKNLDCSSDNPIFIQDIKNLLRLTKEHLGKVTSSEYVDGNIISSFGNECFSISQTKINDDNADLFDETNYPKIFTGEHSEKFIEIMDLIQKFWQLSSHIDTYPTLELVDKGIRINDKQYFYQTLQLLHNKLLILEKISQKTESNKYSR